MKVGDKVTIDFHCAGVVSHQDEPILEVTETHITIGDEETEEQYQYKFSRLTGKCENDNTMFGAKRVLNKKHLIKK